MYSSINSNLLMKNQQKGKTLNKTSNFANSRLVDSINLSLPYKYRSKGRNSILYKNSIVPISEDKSSEHQSSNINSAASSKVDKLQMNVKKLKFGMFVNGDEKVTDEDLSSNSNASNRDRSRRGSHFFQMKKHLNLKKRGDDKRRQSLLKRGSI